MSTDKRQRIWSEIAKLEMCMMVAIDAGVLRARPMVGTIDENENAIWFAANRQDYRDNEILQDDRVCLTYCDHVRNTYVSISGAGRVVHDEAKLKALWTPTIDAWFDDGPQDPNAVLIKFTPRSAEYWDAPSSEIVVALEMLTAGLTEEPPDVAGEHEKVLM